MHKRLSQFVHDHWQVKEGLPQNSVNAILQSRDGYLWLGTYEGLARFDGKKFTVFDRGNTGAFSSNRIAALCEDPQGRLWIATYGGGVVFYDGYAFHPLTNEGIGKYVNMGCMTIDRAGRVWMVTEKGVVSLRDTLIDAIYPSSDFGGHSPQYIAADRQGTIWLGWVGEIYAIKQGRVRRLPPRPFAGMSAAFAPSRGGGIWLIAAINRHNVYLTKYERGYSFKERIPDSVEALFPVPLFEDSHGSLWFSGTGSLVKYDNGRWDSYGKKQNSPIEQIITVGEDADGDIWVGTNGNGLHRFRNGRFTTIGPPEGLPGENVWSVFEDSRKRKWVGFLGGVSCTVDQQGTISSPISGNNFFSFVEDRNNDVWLGGFAVEDPSGHRRLLRQPFWSNTMTMDSSGRIWLAVNDGGIRIAENEKIVDSISLGTALADNTIRVMRTDQDGAMWIGTQAGLFRFHSGTLTNYTVADGLPNNWVRSLYQDSSGALWIATDGGLACMKGGRISSYTEKDGLHSNTIHVILEDDSCKLWMSSNTGVFVVRKSDLQLFDEHRISRIPCVVYGEEDGMRSAEGNGSFQHGGWKMDDGTMWFATIRGVAIVDPNNLMTNLAPPPVVLENITVDGTAISPAGALELQRPAIDISFTYAALSYRIPSRVRYKYKLEGTYAGWIDAAGEQSVTFSNLSPGRYVFHVIASNDDGVWNMTGASVSFMLPPYFWQTWWFFGAVGISLLASFAGIVRYYGLRKARRRIEMLERQHILDRERARISQDMHDEVGSTLTRIAILGELAQRSLDRRDETAAQLEKISEMSRNVIDNLGEIVWALNPKNDTLDNLLAYTRQYVAEYIEVAPVHCVLEFPDGVPPLPLSAETRRNIFLTVKEAVHNIVKHAGATEVRVGCLLQEGRLSISIRDNGKGFVPDERAQAGNGLLSMRKRIEGVGGVFTVSSAPASGTTIVLDVKLPPR
ncbi:MAG TPA: two-component regulator propeller domain-containing protein [Bacteroidota bacterium]|nr:two-component regulator propeller domain-containing protein [Bacteroidota bacterium]